MNQHPIMTRSASVAAGFAVVVTAVTGCSGTVSLPPAKDANNPLCAEIMVRIPSNLVGFERRWTDAQSTAAWGDPAAVVLRCGIDLPGPSALPCLTFGGTDWLILNQENARQRAVTFGTDVAVEVAIERGRGTSFDDVLERLGRMISILPKHASCTAKE
jgi:hypothetical protein